MLELLRAIRATQLESIERQKTILKKTRRFWVVIGVLILAYLAWAVWMIYRPRQA